MCVCVCPAPFTRMKTRLNPIRCADVKRGSSTSGNGYGQKFIVFFPCSSQVFVMLGECTKRKRSVAFVGRTDSLLTYFLFVPGGKRDSDWQQLQATLLDHIPRH